MSKIVVVDAPEVGHEWQTQVPVGPEGIWWRLKAICYNITTSAVAGNRTSRLKVMASPAQPPGFVNMDDAYAGIAQAPAAAAANSTVRYLATEMGELSGFANQFMTLPHDFRVPPGHYIGSQTGAFDVGDQYSAIRLYVEEWVFEPPGERTSNIGDASDAYRVDVIKLNKTMERVAQLLEAQQATP